MKKYAKLAGGIGIIFLVFGGPAALMFQGLFQTIAIIQTGLGLAGCAFFLFYSVGETMETLSQKRTAIMGGVGGLLILTLLIGLNVISQSKWGEKKWDTTVNRIHSLADSSAEVAKGLTQKLTIYAFFDKGQREADVLKNLVEKYTDYTDKLSFQSVDPNEEPALVKELGAGVGEVVIQNQETKRTIKLATATEESLTNALKRVVREDQKTIYFTQGQGQAALETQEDVNGLYIGKLLLEAEGFKVLPLNLAQTNEIPQDAAVVASWGAQRPVSTKELGILETYLAKGGAFVLGQDPMIAATKDRLVSSGFDPLLNRYGLELKPGIVVEFLQMGPFGKKASLEFLAFTYGQHPMVSKLKQENVTQFTTTMPVLAVSNYKGAAKVAALVSVSADAWAESNVRSLFDRSKGAKKDSGDGDLTGPFPIAQVSEWKIEKPAAGDWSPNGKLVVFGSASFATDRMIQAQFNRDLFLNAFNYLAGDSSSGQLSIRPRMWTQSTLEMTEPQRRIVYYASLFVIPQILLILSLMVWLMRRGRA